MHPFGIFFAFAALLAWTGGDFFIQRSTRKVGNWETLFFIGAIGLIGIFPFVKDELPRLFENPSQLALLFLLSIITLVAALFLFEGVKRGKLAIIEPVFGIELTFTVGFSYVLGGEHLGLGIYGVILLVFVGILLTVVKKSNHLYFHKILFERGVIWAAIGSIGMGLMNYLWGVGSQTISPLLTIWFVHSFLAIACFLYLFTLGKAGSIFNHLRYGASTVIPASIFDNLAWIFYGYAMTFAPISIVTTISESYIALLVLLGIFVNREKIAPHQFIGIVCILVGTIIISLMFFD